MSKSNSNMPTNTFDSEFSDFDAVIVPAAETTIKRKRETSSDNSGSEDVSDSNEKKVTVQRRVTKQKANSFSPGAKFLRSIASQTVEQENDLIEEYIEKALIEERQLRFKLSYDFEDSRAKNRIHADAISQILDHVTDGLEKANNEFMKEIRSDSDNDLESKRVAQQFKLTMCSILGVCRNTIDFTKAIDEPTPRQKPSSFNKHCKTKYQCIPNVINKTCIPAVISKKLGFEFPSVYHECPPAYSRIGKRMSNNKRVPIYKADAKTFAARKTRFSSSAAHLPTKNFVEKQSLIEIPIPEKDSLTIPIAEDSAVIQKRQEYATFMVSKMQEFKKNMADRGFDPSTLNISSLEPESAEEIEKNKSSSSQTTDYEWSKFAKSE